mgnify:CR=1 FL=1
MALVTMSHAQSEMPSIPECPDSESIFTWISDTAKFTVKFGGGAIRYVDCMRKTLEASCVLEWIEMFIFIKPVPTCGRRSNAGCKHYLGYWMSKRFSWKVK